MALLLAADAATFVGREAHIPPSAASKKRIGVSGRRRDAAGFPLPWENKGAFCNAPFVLNNIQQHTFLRRDERLQNEIGPQPESLQKMLVFATAEKVRPRLHQCLQPLQGCPALGQGL